MFAKQAADDPRVCQSIEEAERKFHELRDADCGEDLRADMLRRKEVDAVLARLASLWSERWRYLHTPHERQLTRMTIPKVALFCKKAKEELQGEQNTQTEQMLAAQEQCVTASTDYIHVNGQLMHGMGHLERAGEEELFHHRERFFRTRAVLYRKTMELRYTLVQLEALEPVLKEVMEEFHRKSTQDQRPQAPPSAGPLPSASRRGDQYAPGSRKEPGPDPRFRCSNV